MNKRQDFHTKPDWDNISVTSVNRSAAHVKWNPFDSLKSADPDSVSPYISCLNGSYEFKLFNNPDETDDFFLPGYKGFADKIKVPGNWELQGFGEPIYTNVPMPWKPDLDEPCNIFPEKGKTSKPNPPFIPSANPTGCYRHYFDVPANFKGREIFLRFDGVECAFYLWINGKPVGYSQDSKLPCEFNVTEFLTEGKNLLALQVMRFAESTYLEDQDYWYLSGIYRSVWLVAKPKLRISDYFIKALPNLPIELGGGKFSADVSVSRVNGFADCSVEAYIFDVNGAEIAKGNAKPMPSAQYRMDAVPTSNTARININLPKIDLWSPESPVLYKAVFALISPDGEVLDVETCNFGFKSVEVKNGIVYLNGRRLVICGVNRHEHYYKTGRTLSVERMTEEIKQMKLMNINSVRTCHYPDMPEWYDLCDKHGILVICECNIETHALAGALSHNPEWATNFLERAVRMVQNYKNHACIYSWSLGNESGTGANHAAMYGYIKEFDSTRLCQYEAGEPGKNISDIRGNMYAPIDKIIKMLTDPDDTRPIILVEFLYQICNSGGGMEHFVMLTETYERFQGGYIWDWQDKALEAKDANGNAYFGYGGDFGEDMTEFECPLFMTNNGIIMPDLTWKPVAYDVRQAYAPAYFTKGQWTKENQYILKNKYLTKDLSGYKCVANLRENGVVVATKDVALETVAPMSEKWFDIVVPYEFKGGEEYHLDLTIFDDCENQISSNQFLLKAATPFVIDYVGFISRLDLNDENFIVTGETGKNFEYIFSRKTGNIISMKKNGVDYIINSGELCLDRPKSGLDPFDGWGDIYKEFELIQRENTGKQTLANALGTIYFIQSFKTKTGDIIPAGVRYGVNINGDIYVSFYINATAYSKNIQRAGLELILPEGFNNLEYFGCGETENYCDRKFSAKLGFYKSTVEKQHFAFAPPSENGGHEDVRWVILKNNAGNSVKIEGAKPFHFDAHNYKVADCRNAAHDHEIKKLKETVLHIDAAHAPIGGNMAWSTTMPENLALKGGYYTLDFKMTLGE